MLLNYVFRLFKYMPLFNFKYIMAQEVFHIFKLLSILNFK